ncbi:MAG: DUF4160 domain-containing protein [Melioribacteraceae bacterium]
MPEISRFMGMVIQMYYRDHVLPHIHIRDAETTCTIDLDGNILGGKLPLHKLHIIQRWMTLHKKELERNWNLVKDKELPERIAPWE